MPRLICPSVSWWTSPRSWSGSAKEIEKAQNGLRGVEQKLSNEKFVSRAPEAVVNAEREKAAKYKELIAKLEESAKAMQA